MNDFPFFLNNKLVTRFTDTADGKVQVQFFNGSTEIWDAPLFYQRLGEYETMLAQFRQQAQRIYAECTGPTTEGLPYLSERRLSKIMTGGMVLGGLLFLLPALINRDPNRPFWEYVGRGLGGMFTGAVVTRWVVEETSTIFVKP